LRLVHGSVEAGYLTAFVKVEAVPSIVFIGNQTRGGQIELLPKGPKNQAVDDIVHDLSKLLESNVTEPTKSQEPDTAVEPKQEDDADVQVSTPTSERAVTSSSISRRDPSAQPVATSSSENADAANPIERPSKTPSKPAIGSNRSPSRPWESFSSGPNVPGVSEPASDSNPEPTTESPQEPSSKAKGKRKAVEPEIEPEVAPKDETVDQPSSLSAKQAYTEAQDWAKLQRQKNLESRMERQRVLAQIEADKKARREAADARKLQLTDERVNSSSSTLPKTKRSEKKSHEIAHIQVRLPSGLTIRKQFPSSVPAAELRPWIDTTLRSEGETSVPAYKLKHLPGPPEPARPIDVGDEQHSLQELDLVPSATLVLLPIKGSVDAYASGSGWGLLGLPFAAVGVATGVVGGAVGWLTGSSGASQATDSGLKSDSQARKRSSSSTGANSAANGRSAGNTGRIRTMAEMRADGDRDATQLYNGNQVSYLGLHCF
jgi:UBX domain-containing protein